MERRINSGHDTIIFNFFLKCPGEVAGRQSFSFFKFITKGSNGLKYQDV